jgi:hypothetical protein
MTELTGKVGFASPISEKALSRKRTLGVELIATLALAVCLIIAATAVSIGMARAQALAPVRTIHAAHCSPLMPAALIIGHHFSISAFW